MAAVAPQKPVAIIISVNYADFLAATLPKNRKRFHHTLVITVKEDSETIRVAAENDAEVFLTEKVHEAGSDFNYGGLMYEAQKYIHAKFPDHWILKLDADIVLPSDPFNLEVLNRLALYGALREDYATPTITVGIPHAYNKSPQIPGFFQLYYNKGRFYEKWSSDCSHVDLLFSDSFGIKRKLPLTVRHYGLSRVNWKGRKSAPWASAEKK